MNNILTGRLISVRAILIITAVVLIAAGIITIYTIGHPAEPSPASNSAQLANLWKKQLVFTSIAIAAFIIINLIHYRLLGRLSYWIYAAVLLLLTLLMIDKYIIDVPDSLIAERNNAYRWIRIPVIGLNIQPSEICKLAYILALAWYLRYRSNYRNFSSLLGPFALTLLPMILILLEPDLGTVMLMMPIFFTLLFLAGARVKHLVIIILLAVLVSPLLWLNMKNYQKTRISSILLQYGWFREKAEQHPKLANILVDSNFSMRRWENDWGYHLIRSKYSVASGRTKGYGFAKGPFVKYDFLPERHNDFIFAIIAHQWGFFGAVFILAVYLIFIICGLEIATSNTEPFAKLAAAGIVAMFVVEVLVNVGMTVGLMPITGLTLPLVSYGGSSLLVSMTAVGILNNIGRRRPFSVAPKLPR